MTAPDDEHDAKTVRYVKRNHDGVVAAIAIAVSILVVLVLALVAIRYGVE